MGNGRDADFRIAIWRQMIRQSPEAAEVARVASDITNYLHDCPNAQDNVNGITRWWLGSQGETVSVETVDLALQCLVDAGVVVKTDVPGGQALYSLGRFTA